MGGPSKQKNAEDSEEVWQSTEREVNLDHALGAKNTIWSKCDYCNCRQLQHPAYTGETETSTLLKSWENTAGKHSKIYRPFPWSNQSQWIFTQLLFVAVKKPSEAEIHFPSQAIHSSA